MATRLKQLQIDEVSFVDEPANKGARVLLLKRDGGEETMQEHIEKCLRAVTNEDVSALTKADFADALDAVAKAAQKDDETFEQSYCRMLGTETGQLLTVGHEAAKLAPIADNKPEPTAVDKAFAPIAERAGQLMHEAEKQGEPISEAQAITKVLRDDPSLYSQYEAERRK